MHRYAIRVRYGDTDQMGFAYYAHYLRWFEIGRAEMLRALGWSYRAVEEAGIQLPVLEARCRYFKPARYDDELWIETGVLEVRRASVRFGYRIVRVSGEELLATGETEHCFLGPEGKPARPPERMADLLAQAPRAIAEPSKPASRISAPGAPTG
ncbi:MAG TPA: thioesterase family protein [Candidatus Eisenbacteria bacterium]|nr:thioesterase family protein [Candidatus Eisenbacteria bacterium]